MLSTNDYNKNINKNEYSKKPICFADYQSNKHTGSRISKLHKVAKGVFINFANEQQRSFLFSIFIL